MTIINECGHPDRLYCARGMCRLCYMKMYNSMPEVVLNSRERNISPEGRAKRRARLYLEHGITEVEYLALYKHQDGRCAICEKAIEGKNIHIDHNHLTNKTRGLLCSNCNTGIGLLKSDTLGATILLKAVNYLESHNG